MAKEFFVGVSRYAGFALIFFLCGCVTTKSAPSRYYVLDPQYASDLPGQSFAGKNRMITGIGPVKIPTYLDRQEIVTRGGDNKIVLHDFDKWGEPLADGITRVLVEDLSRHLRKEPLLVVPWSESKAITHQVIVEVVRLDGVLGGDVQLTVRWTFFDREENRVVLSKYTSFAEPVRTPGYEAFVAAQSRSVGGLGQEIAEGIRVVLEQRE